MYPVVHFELPLKDRARGKAFYAKAFGWKANQLGPEMNNYVVVHTGPTDADGMNEKPGMINGGLYEKTADMPEMHPAIVIGVDDIVKVMGQVRDAGGTVIGEPMDIPGVGKFVAFVDTEGNRGSILQPSRPM
jgi:predicted enzyme related to lactoylglutathione lyase